MAGDDVDLASPARTATLVLSTMTEVGAGSGVGGATVSRSVDGGRHWTEVVDANLQVVDDRPFLLDNGPHDLLLTFSAPPGNIEAVRSSNAGASFGPPVLVTPVPPNPVLSVNGGPAVDAGRHELVVPYASSITPGCLSGTSGCFNLLSLARSADGTSWTQETIADLGASRGITSVPNVAADSEGREYAAFAVATGTSLTGTAAGGAELWFTHSDSPGKPWAPLTRIDRSGTSAMLAWVVASGTGHVGVAWYASDEPDAETTAAPWVVRAAVSDDGGRTWTVGNVSDHTVYYGSGGRHQSSVWDLLALAFGSRGELDVAWTDLGSPSAGSPAIGFASQVPGRCLSLHEHPLAAHRRSPARAHAVECSPAPR